MSKVLISYFSFSGKTKQLAEAAAEGARSSGAKVELKEVGDTTVGDLSNADAWLVATPQTFGTMAAETKRLFERLWLAKGEITAKPAFGVIICHAKEPVATLDLTNRFATLFGFEKVGDSVTVDGSQLEAGLEPSRQLGAALATTGEAAQTKCC